ncbi:MAG: (deoxy)nucleoside triphosphate pyrophosphohydrolase [Bowdeniella nasicola]|nr:(deoxy)nucleoside triphosphate pyrophosphohydrolase [Bowdeniella nasicola]
MPDVVAAAIVRPRGASVELLCAQRSAPPRLAGLFEFPGGKVEPGEDPCAALHRELAEELGVSVRLGSRVRAPGDGDWPITSNLTMRVWLAELADGQRPRALEDHASLVWATLADAEALPWIEADRPILAAVARALEIGPEG